MVGAALLLAAVLSTSGSYAPGPFAPGPFAPGPFVLVNNAGATLESLSIRPADSRGSWRPLGSGGLPASARAAMPAPGGDLCAFDIRATLAAAVVTWASVNLCDVRTVTLNRRPDGTLWVDYD